jgi:hypothetical protein
VLQSLSGRHPNSRPHLLRRFQFLVRLLAGYGLVPHLMTCCITEVKADLRWWRTSSSSTTEAGSLVLSSPPATLVPWATQRYRNRRNLSPFPGGPPQDVEGLMVLLVFKFSKWKELPTQSSPPRSGRRCTVCFVVLRLSFYRIRTTYWIAASGSSASPGLHALIEVA